METLNSKTIRCGAVEACLAHNQKDGGSKPLIGIGGDRKLKGHWSSGMILRLGRSGPVFDSRVAPLNNLKKADIAQGLERSPCKRNVQSSNLCVGCLQ